MADEFVVWEDRFNVGIVMIDEQHRRLVDFTNALFDGCRQGKEGANEAAARSCAMWWPMSRCIFQAKSN